MQTLHLEHTLRRLRCKHLSLLPITHGDLQTALGLQSMIERHHPDTALHQEAIDLVEALSAERFPIRDFETYLADLSEQMRSQTPMTLANEAQPLTDSQLCQQAYKRWLQQTNESEVFI